MDSPGQIPSAITIAVNSAEKTIGEDPSSKRTGVFPVIQLFQMVSGSDARITGWFATLEIDPFDRTPRLSMTNDAGSRIWQAP